MNLVDALNTRGMIALYSDSDVLSLPIKLGSWSRWTHAGFCLGDGTAIQCDSRQRGVVIEAALQQRNDYAVGLYPGDIEKAVAFYRQRLQSADGYDYFGLLSSIAWRIGIRMPLHAGWNCATFLIAPMLLDPTVRVLLMKHGMAEKPPSAFTPRDFQTLFGAK